MHFYTDDSPIAINRYLLMALGFELEKNTNILVDQSIPKKPIVSKNRFIKINIDPNKVLYISENDLLLEPLHPKCTGLMELLFGKFLIDASSAEAQIIPEVQLYFFDDSPDGKSHQLTIKYEDGTAWTGNWHLNKNISYLEAIFALEGSFAEIDLRKYDIDYTIPEAIEILK